MSISIFSNSTADGHLEHLPHNNGGGNSLTSDMYVNQALSQDYASPGEPIQIQFSIQDYDLNDVYNIETAVEIYDSITGQRIELFPWEFHSIGDFEVNYTFEDRGNYLVVISLADENASPNQDIPPRSILMNTLNCDCERTVFNISITTEYGLIWNSTMLIAILLPLIVFGTVLAMRYLDTKKQGKQPNRSEVMRYIVMFLAVAGGIIHLGVFADHSTQRMEYSIFLMSAAVLQIGFGTFYVLMTLVTPIMTSRQTILSHHNKIMALNIFGLIGTSILVGLYVYTVIFPPPLSPINQPEEIGLDGIFAKAVEIATLIGIIWVIRYEKKRKNSLLENIDIQSK